MHRSSWSRRTADPWVPACQAVPAHQIGERHRDQRRGADTAGRRDHGWHRGHRRHRVDSHRPVSGPQRASRRLGLPAGRRRGRLLDSARRGADAARAPRPRRAAGALAASLLAATGEADLDALHAAFLQRPQPRHWARYAPAVINSGDPAAALLTTQAAAALAGIGGQVADRLGAPAGLPVVLAGGLMSDPRLREATAAAMVSAVPGCTVQPLAEPPVAGAVRLAAAAATARP